MIVDVYDPILFLEYPMCTWIKLWLNNKEARQ
jgi:hypothetical protein